MQGRAQVEMGARALTNHYGANPRSFSQSQFVLSGLAALAKMLVAPGGIRTAITAVPWWQIAPLSLLRMQSQVRRSAIHWPSSASF
jgi:hypothetical protein